VEMVYLSRCQFMEESYGGPLRLWNESV
jgi:hypothetical protein